MADAKLVTMANWVKFDRDICNTKLYHGMRYGEAFCGCFGIADDTLFNMPERSQATQYIFEHYIAVQKEN